jgi:hypothetical protein
MVIYGNQKFGAKTGLSLKNSLDAAAFGVDFYLTEVSQLPQTANMR